VVLTTVPAGRAIAHRRASLVRRDLSLA